MAAMRKRQGSITPGNWGRRPSNASDSSDFDPDLPRAPVGLAPPGLAGRRWQGREDPSPKQSRGFDETQQRRGTGNDTLPAIPQGRSRMDGLYPVDEDEA